MYIKSFSYLITAERSIWMERQADNAQNNGCILKGY